MTTHHPDRTPSPNVFKQRGYLSRHERETLKGHKGACVWLTGYSASGKSSIATALEELLHERALHTFGLDGDNLRRGLCADLGFSAEDRAENIRRAGAVASLMVDAGLLVIAAFISPYAAGREAIRASMPPGRYVECHVVCPIAVCAERDPKGLYARAKAGDLANFTGISAPYEAPEHPELTLHTAPEETTPRGCAHQIVRYLEAQGVIPPSSTT
ncbi:MAG: adenylyl-sulfate kinase [Myxococcota bacterium]